MAAIKYHLFDSKGRALFHGGHLELVVAISRAFEAHGIPVQIKVEHDGVQLDSNLQKLVNSATELLLAVESFCTELDDEDPSAPLWTIKEHKERFEYLTRKVRGI